MELKQTYEKDRITVKALLNSKAIGLVISLEFVRKYKFSKKKLKRLIYVKNIDSIFNYKEPIEHMVEVELFYRGHKKKIEINMIGDQNQSMILEMLCQSCK